MRAAVFHEPRRVEAGDRPDAGLREPTDAVVRVALACVCGTDLWFYRGDSPFKPGPIGHEFIGIVEDVGAEVQQISNARRRDPVVAVRARVVAKGELVIASFMLEGTCTTQDTSRPTTRRHATEIPANSTIWNRVRTATLDPNWPSGRPDRRPPAAGRRARGADVA